MPDSQPLRMKTQRAFDGFSDQFVDATDCLCIDVATREGGGPYPTMIGLDFYDNGGTILSDDARKLATMLVKAADAADAIDSARFATAPPQDLGQNVPQELPATEGTDDA